VYYDAQFWHYQIQKHGEDAFFSIDGQLPIHHGLEDLIDYYRSNSTNLCTKLKNFVKKLPPPIEARRHGKHNLLHRATKHNHLDVVKEMLKTSYRSLDAKDEFGMTAVHLACKNKVNPEIMKLLIERGATLTSRDSSGNTPLHVSSLIGIALLRHSITSFFLFSSSLVISAHSMPAKITAKKWLSCLSPPTKT
jgi:tyrosine-protein kinase shark